jgi:hypothetical protein
LLGQEQIELPDQRAIQHDAVGADQRDTERHVDAEHMCQNISAVRWNAEPNGRDSVTNAGLSFHTRWNANWDGQIRRNWFTLPMLRGKAGQASPV